MKVRPAIAIAFAIALLGAALAASPSAALTTPSNFVVDNAVPGATFTVPVVLAFLPDGRWLVGEKRGRVYVVDNGVKNPTPMLAIDREVLDVDDRGMLGLAVDPNFATNRYIYVLYTVDPDSNDVDNNDDAFGRLTRYQVSASNPNVVNPASRTVLIGATWRTGVPSGSPSHAIGTLRFGADGSLLVSCGEGAQFNISDAGGLDPGMFGANKTDPYEDIGAFRAQYLGSLGGKILRLNPANGQGYASNPFYDGDLNSNYSRVWAYGFRNPFRFTVRPGTGSLDPAAGNPGVLYIGDVGWSDVEEQNVATQGGRNFGWPCYEGMGPGVGYPIAHPAHHDCASIGTPDNPSPVTFPIIAAQHGDPGNSTPVGIQGNAAIGGAWYMGSLYPSAYRQRYFFADYGKDWIKVATMSSNDQLVSIATFSDGAGGPVCLQTDPQTGDILYVAIYPSEVRRIRYVGATGNASPIAAAGAVPNLGLAPLTVQFSSAGSFDPENDPIATSWNFGDGQGATAANPSHTYAIAGAYDAVLTVTDGHGGVGRDTAHVIAATNSNFPTTGVVDNFNRANGPVGSPWTGLVTGLNVASNAISPDDYISATWNEALFGPDQEAFVTLSTLSAIPEHNLMLKIQGTTWDTGHIEVRYDALAGNVLVSTYTPGASWATRGVFAATFNNGDVLGARAWGNGSVEVYRNGIQVGVASVDGWPFIANSGRIGLTIAGPASSRLDNFGGGDVVLNNNTRPHGVILSPIGGSFYYEGLKIALNASATDNQDPPASLTYRWEVDVHHNNHVHPNSHAFDTQSASFDAANHDDGTGVFYRIRLIVTDSGGLKDSSFVDLFPEIDLQPSAVTTVPASPTDVAPADYTFTLANRGRMPAPFSHWVLRAGATLVAQGDTVVAGNDSVVIVRRFGPGLAAGGYALRVTADSLGAVVETNEANNAVTRNLTVVSGPDFTPPSFVTGPTVTPGTTSASAQWTTNEAARGAVRYGLGPGLGDSVTTALGTTHAATLSGLARGTLYYDRVAITDGAGNTALSALSTFTTLANRSPSIASATATPTSGGAPLTVQLTASATDLDGDALTYSWAFGDGQSGTGASLSHVYAAGSFTATLTVTDGFGGSATSSLSITATPGGFPTTGILDNFNRANGPIGGAWVDEITNLVISGNQLLQNASGWRSPVWNGAVFGPDQEAYVKLTAITATSPEHDLMLKVQGLTSLTGHIEVRYDAISKKIYVTTYAPGQSWITRGTVSPITLVGGDVLGARAFGNGNVEVFRNGVKLGTYSVTGWPFAANGGRLGLTLASTSASRLDDFGGGNVLTNSKPTATIVAPANNSFYATGQSVTLNGSAIDAQDPPAALAYRWEVDLNAGGVVVSSTSFATAGASFVPQSAAGANPFYTLRLIVTDSGGLKDTATVRLNPEIDLEPSPVTVTPDPASDAAPALYRFAIANAGRMPAAPSRWVLRAGTMALAQGDTAVAGLDSVIVTRSIGPVLAAGAYTLRVTVDSLGTVLETDETDDARVRTLTVADGTAPVFTTGPTATPAGSSATIQWTTNEASRGSVRWGPTAALGDSVATPLGSNHSAVLSGLARGAPYSYQVAATDAAGNTRLSAVLAFATVANRAPVIASATATPGSGSAPLAVQFASSVSDTDGDALGYVWDFGDGQSGSGAAPAHTYGAGTFTAVLTATDGFGGSATAGVPITAINGPPHATIVTPSNGTTFVAGQTVALEGSGLDSQDPPASLAFRWEVDRRDLSGLSPNVFAAGGASASFVAESGTLLDYTVRLIVTDSDGLRDTAKVRLDPEIDLEPSFVTVTPTSPTNNAPANYRFAIVNRGRMPAAPSRWVLRADGGTLAQGDAAVGALDSAVVTQALGATLSVGNHVLRIVVDSLSAIRETDEANDARTQTLTVVDGIPPAFVTGPTITPGANTATVQWTTNETARGAARFGTTAALGDSVTTPLGTTHLATLSGLATGTTYFAVVAITDAAGNTTLSTPLSFATSSNRPPVAVAAATPASGASPLTVAFSSTGSNDPDGDPLTYAWSFGNGQTSTLANPSTVYASPGTYSASLTVRDPSLASASAGLTVTVTLGFPGTAVLDDFNRANGAVGGSWVDETTNLTVNANQFAITTTAARTTVWNGASFGPNQEAYVTLAAITSGSPEHDLMLKVQGTSWSTGHIEVRYDHVVKSITVSTYAPSGGWVTRGSVAVTMAPGDRLGARAYATGSVEIYRNALKLGTYSTSGWPYNALGGRLGMTLDNVSASRLDNFGGGTLPAGTALAASSPTAPAGDDPAGAADPARSADPGVTRDVTGARGDHGGIRMPATIALSRAYPNPSDGTVSFSLELPSASRVTWVILDLQGRRIGEGTREAEAGRSVLSWSRAANGVRRAGAGLYLARVTIGRESFTRRFVLLD